MSKKFQLFIELHNPSTPTGKNPTEPDWKRIADALCSAFDQLRQHKTTVLAYHTSAHSVYVLPDHLVKQAEEREEQELARALLNDTAEETACGAGPESQPPRKAGPVPTARSTPQPR